MLTVKDAATHAWFWVGIIFAVIAVAYGIVEKAGFAKVERVQQLEVKQAELKGELLGEVKAIGAKVDIMFDTTRQREYRERGVIIPDPAAPVDGGAR